MKTTVEYLSTDGTGPLMIALDDEQGNRLQLTVNGIDDARVYLAENCWSCAWFGMVPPTIQHVRHCVNLFATAVSGTEADKHLTVEADGNDGKTRCDYCGIFLPSDVEAIATCDASQHLTLCRPCYNKAGNAVR